ncbi:MAG: DUF480 domain-containing protein [Gammaproteobacteria bacterium]|nr:DUF480 domain-containing protein [Gammaproteobacteria bacterium]
MDMDLTHLEIRILGSLIEKEITTPDQYPLSLNALVLACNQKSNREPVLKLDESETSEVIDDLVKRYLIVEQTGFGSRIVKFKHKFCNSILGELQLSPQQLGVICVLFLRGPQTPGELRTRTNRLCTFNDVEEVDATLKELMQWESGPLVTRFAREPGKRESRYAHLFSGEVEIIEESRDHSAISANSGADSGTDDRLETLEQQVEQMRTEIDRLQQQISHLTNN